MTTPHTVTLVCFQGSVPYLTVLRGVMLQGTSGKTVLRNGEMDETKMALYIPFSVDARNPAGEETSFLLPYAFASCPDPGQHWTLQPEGESAGRCGFFVKGVLDTPLTLAEARRLYDEVYVIAGYSVRDYGSPSMRHWEVRSKISSRYYGTGLN